MGIFDFFRRDKKASEETADEIEKLKDKVTLNKKKMKIERKIEYIDEK